MIGTLARGRERIAKTGIFDGQIAHAGIDGQRTWRWAVGPGVEDARIQGLQVAQSGLGLHPFVGGESLQIGDDRRQLLHAARCVIGGGHVELGELDEQGVQIPPAAVDDLVDENAEVGGDLLVRLPGLDPLFFVAGQLVRRFGIDLLALGHGGVGRLTQGLDLLVVMVGLHSHLLPLLEAVGDAGGDDLLPFDDVVDDMLLVLAGVEGPLAFGRRVDGHVRRTVAAVNDGRGVVGRCCSVPVLARVLFWCCHRTSDVLHQRGIAAHVGDVIGDRQPALQERHLRVIVALEHRNELLQLLHEAVVALRQRLQIVALVMRLGLATDGILQEDGDSGLGHLRLRLRLRLWLLPLPFCSASSVLYFCGAAVLRCVVRCERSDVVSRYKRLLTRS
mmetsp:Transcript_5857/g.17472  ORF Transcript_5857/g.17472 Transcript_5857/m.17472 type:complete len:390 (+) Transcript_5857:889-2058(+)